MKPVYHIYNIGDHALTVDFGQDMSIATNEYVMLLERALKDQQLSGILDIVLAYSSISILYDPITLVDNPFITRSQSLFQSFSNFLTELIHEIDPQGITHTSKQLTIPVCYEEPFGYDVDKVLQQLGMSKEALIKRHSSIVYRIFMIGFLPGFPYLGMLDQDLFTERKSQPMFTPKGSVAIAGLQTGIYPMDSPGGWNVIGRTPMKIFSAMANPPVPWEPGDTVQFEPISADRFFELEKEGSHGC